MNTGQSQEQVKRFFDSYAADFNAIYDVGERSTSDRFFDRFTRASMFGRVQVATDHFVKEGIRTLLDVGSGPGQQAVKLAAEHEMDVVGVDIAPEMVKIAEELARRHGVEDRCDFVTHDFMDWTPGRPVEACLSLGVVEYIENPAPFVRRMADVAERTVVFSLPVKWHVLTPQRIIRYKLRKCPLWFYSMGDVTRLMEDAGVERYRVERVNRDWVVMIDSSAKS